MLQQEYTEPCELTVIDTMTTCSQQDPIPSSKEQLQVQGELLTTVANTVSHDDLQVNAMQESSAEGLLLLG